MRRVVTSACIKLEDTPLLVPVVDRYGCNGRLAIELCEVEPEEGDDGLWCDPTVNLPQYGLPGDDWAFVPEDGLPYPAPSRLRDSPRSAAPCPTAASGSSLGQFGSTSAST